MNEHPAKEIVTVAEMARVCRLSRSRFYTLIQTGIMPQPSRNPETQRPFYSREQQEQCLLVRKTNCGINGKAILFYATSAPSRTLTARTKPRRTTGENGSRQPTRVERDPIIDELIDGLAQLGLPNVDEHRLKTVLHECYPDGHSGIAIPTLLMTVFRRLRENGMGSEGTERRNSPDNLAG